MRKGGRGVHNNIGQRSAVLGTVSTAIEKTSV